MCRSTRGSCSVTPRACPAGRMVTLATGTAGSASAATRAWPDSWTATACFSSGRSTFDPSRRPRMTRSRAAKKSSAVITWRLSRTAKIAASLARLARSAPENPGVPRATTVRSTSGASFLSRTWTLRIAAPSLTLGSGGVTLEDRGSAADVGQRDRDLPVEPAGAQQRRVEDLGPVGGAEDHDAGRGVEAVHLGQQLVEGLLPLVVGDDRAQPGPALADGVDLVGEDDRG